MVLTDQAVLKDFRWHRTNVGGCGQLADAEAARRTVLGLQLVNGGLCTSSELESICRVAHCSVCIPTTKRLKGPLPSAARSTLWSHMLGVKASECAAIPTLQQLVGQEAVEELRSRKAARGGGIVLPELFREELLSSVTNLFPPSFPEQVIYNDIERSLWTLYPNEEERRIKRMELKECLYRILLHNPTNSTTPVFHYYQGLHEIIGQVMYVLDANTQLTLDSKVGICEVMVKRFFRPMCAPSMQTSESLLIVVYFILEAVDPELARLLEQLHLGPRIHFALSWVLTWFCYDVSEKDTLQTMMDLLLTMSTPNDADQSCVIIYWCVALLRLHCRGVLEQFVDVDEDPDIAMGMAYSKVGGLPRRIALEEGEKGAILVTDLYKEACRLRIAYPHAPQYMAIVARHVGSKSLDGPWVDTPLRRELRKCAGLDRPRKAWFTLGCSVVVVVMAIVMKRYAVVDGSWPDFWLWSQWITGVLGQTRAWVL